MAFFSRGERAWPIASPVPNAFLPALAIVLLKQNKGESARCVVQKGDLVREGSLLGRADSEGQANVHAPVPGIVRDIKTIRVASGAPVQAVEISFEGRFDRLGKREEKYVWTSMSRADMIQSLRERGVVEMSYSGRPIVDVISTSRNISALVLLEMESEPYLNTERAILYERRNEVFEGLAILRQLINPGACFFVAEKGDDEDLKDICNYAKELQPAIELVVLAARYPQDMPNQIASVLRSGKRYLSAKDVCIVRPSTALAVYESLVFAKPVIERYVTIAGGSIKKPAVLKARIGTPIGDLIEECGGFLDPPERIVLGGPLRGEPVYNLDSPITKLTGAVLALSAQETNRSVQTACIRCGRCADVCPERLSPSEILRRLEKGKASEALALGLGRCTSCGACGYICPSRIPLVEALATGKQLGEASR